MRELGDLQEPLDLLPHDPRAADRPVQNGLLHHHPQRRGVLPFQQALAAQPQLHTACELLLAAVRQAAAQHGVRVFAGLQKPRDVLGLVRAEGLGAGLQADVGGEPARDGVAIGVPPARLVGLLGQVDELVDLLAVRAEGLQELLDVERLQGHLGLLQPTDRQGRHAQSLGRVLQRGAGADPHLLQPTAEDHAQDCRRAGAGTGFAHAQPPDGPSTEPF